MSRPGISLKSFSDLPLARKMSVITLFTSTLVLLLASPVFLMYSLSTSKRMAEEALVSLAEVTALGVAPAVAFRDADTARETLASLRADPRVRSAVLLVGQGALFADYLAPGGRAASFVPGGENGGESCYRGVFSIRQLSYSLCREVVLEGEVLGMLHLETDLSPLWADVRLHLWITLLVLLGGFGLAWLLARQFGEVLARPVRHLADTTRRVTEQGDYSVRAEGFGQDEVGTLTQDFNTMLEAIGRRDQTLLRHGERLEEEVGRRTAELTQVVTKLEAARDQAETANRAKSRFLSSMSHELRTPMNAILGFSQMLQMIEDEPLTPTQERYVSHILRGANHLLDLINEVLDLSRVESGRVLMSLESVEAGPVIESCLSLTATLAEPRKVWLIDESDAAALPPVMADRTRLQQVLLNLLSNAVKYNRQEGTVTLSTTLEEEGATVRFSVTDTGPGIPEERQEELFQPFNRLGAEAGEEEGSGIGLVITRRLVELMQGKIGYSSAEGRGSTFWITLPTAKEDWIGRQKPGRSPEESEAGPVTPDPGVESARTILYIEDNPSNLQLMEEVLRYEGHFQLITAHTAELGLALAHSQHPDIILMDINLPGMDGFQALKLLQESPATREVPVLAVSANCMPSEVKRGLSEGFCAYITKPFQVPELLAAIREAAGE